MTTSTNWIFPAHRPKTAVVNGATTTFTYDRTAQLISRTDPGGSTNFSYDAYGNLVSSARAFNAVTTYTYDLGDRLTAMSTPGPTAYSYTLDALGRPLSRSGGSATIGYAYVGVGRTAWQTTSGATTVNGALGPDESRLALSPGPALTGCCPTCTATSRPASTAPRRPSPMPGATTATGAARPALPAVAWPTRGPTRAGWT
jgi:YD repeat-containing protein